jgi:hypothetical protein
MKWLGMKEHKYQFENEWRSAFSQAEAMPSHGVWERIDFELNKKDSKKDNRNLIIWQMVAAVSLALASGVLLFNYFNQPRSFEESILSKAPEQTQESILHGKKDREVTGAEEQNTTITESETDKTIVKRYIEIIPRAKDSKPGIIASTEMQDVAIGFVSPLKYEKLDKVGEIRLRRAWLPTPDVHKIAYSRPLPAEPLKSRNSYPFWAGIKVAGGASGSGESSLSPLALSLRSQSETFNTSPNAFGSSFVQISSSTGFGYSLGFSVGKNIGQRIFIQSGLQYVVQNINGSTNAYFRRLDTQEMEPVFIFNADKPLYSGGTQIRQIEFYSKPIRLVSSLEYFSIPLQAGYLIVDRRIDWGIAAGFSTDFFLRDIVTMESGEIDGKVTRNKDEESPFRPVGLSAILSTEVNYNLTDNYSISLEPRYSVGLNPVTRKEVDVEERRLKSLTLGVKLRYIF